MFAQEPLSPEMNKPRILLGDDHALIVEGLRSVLARDFEIVAVATNGQDVVAETKRLNPDVVLLDVSMPVLNGMEAARQIRSLAPDVKIVFVTQKADREYVRAGFRLGASGYVLKQAAASEVIPAICAALSGRYYVTPSLKDVPNEPLSSNSSPRELFGATLTSRQREVLQLVAEGKSNKEVAYLLRISLKTVEFHKARVMDELGLHTTAELTRYALEHGIIGA
jgi:DNA-binding NarL/FixJ family response regulator